MVFVHCFLFEGVAYGEGEADLLVLSWWCQCCCFKFSIPEAELFFRNSSFFWLCASFMLLGYDVVAELGCNWYPTILIYALYRKKSRYIQRTFFLSFCSDGPRENHVWE
jgi:hypothetical protein